jgi:transposase
VNGHHLVTEAGLFQFGHSKDDPSLPQVKVMMSSLDPLGIERQLTWPVSDNYLGRSS